MRSRWITFPTWSARGSSTCGDKRVRSAKIKNLGSTSPMRSKPTSRRRISGKILVRTHDSTESTRYPRKLQNTSKNTNFIGDGRITGKVSAERDRQGRHLAGSYT